MVLDNVFHVEDVAAGLIESGWTARWTRCWARARSPLGERQHSVLLAEITPDDHAWRVGRLAAGPAERRLGADVGVARQARVALPHVHVMHQRGLNVYDILRYRSLAITKDALQELVRRIDAPIKR